MRKLALLLITCCFMLVQAWAQTRSVSGRVTDEKGSPLSGATVVVKGSSTGTATRADGSFTLSIPGTARTLVITFQGYVAQDVSIGNQTTINVRLSATESNLNDVVVTGYTRERKNQFAGAASTIATKSIETVPVGSFDQLLQGRVPGLLANSGSGQPGASAFVRIRGTSSISGQGQPLYIVDGVPVAGADFATLNANDFESITVLKDASASALYGSRGGLGVIVITTKRGRTGQTNFTYRTQYGFTRRPQPSQFNQLNSRQMLDYEEFVGGFNTGLIAPGWTYSRKNPAYAALPATSPATSPYSASQARYDFIRDSFATNNVDYYDILFKTGITRTNEINMSGGAGNTRYFVSLGNFNQQGTDRKSQLNRYTLRFNLDNTVGKLTTQLNTSIGYSISNINEGTFYSAAGTANPFAMAWRAKPYENPYDANGNLIFGTSASLAPKAIGNLIERSNNSFWFDRQIKANTGLTLTYRPIRQIALKNTFGLDANQDYVQGSINANSFVGSLQTYNAGYLNESMFSRLQLINTSAIIYTDRFADKHEVEIGGYFEAIRQWNKGFGFTLYNLDPRLTQTGQSAGTLPIPASTAVTNFAQNGSSAKSGYGIRSFFATGRYTFDNKYTITGNVRKDETSRILKEENKGIFNWSVGAIWDAMREKFLENQKALTTLRVRGSYGIVPNINSIPTPNSYGINSIYFTGGVPKYLGAQEPVFNAVTFPGSSTTAVAPTLVNPDLRIEKVEKWNIGADLGFLKNRINLNVDFYRNITKDLFVNQTLPASAGFYGTALAINAGSMENRGVELNLSVDVIRSKNIDLTLAGNHAINKNKILDLGAVSEYTAGTGIIRVGTSYGTHYSYAYLGADPATGKPIYKRPDGTPTTNISEAGQFADFGSWLPVHTGGFSASFRLQRFTIDALFSYQFDVRRYNNTQNWVTQGDATYTGAVTQSQQLLLDQWRRPGDVKELQSPAYTRNFTSYDITNAKFLRFRNLNIAYTIPAFRVKSLSIIKSARVYLQGQNLAIWSPWSGLDPEDDNNISLGEFPNPRAFVAGVDINF